jgi:PilZ domain-containing protein
MLAREPESRSEIDVERRKAARYVLRVPVLFSWEDHQPRQARGFTRDISASAAYVVCEKSYCPIQGDIVEIQLILPSVAHLEAQGIKLKFKGHVLRSGEFQEESGFAVLANCAMELNTGKNGEEGEELP